MLLTTRSNYMIMKNKRLNLLTSGEIKVIYDYPVFSDNERQFYFALSEQELAMANTLKTIEGKIYFTLVLGYFKAKTILFKINFKKSYLDINYIKKNIFSYNRKISFKSLGLRTITRIKNKIYFLFNIEENNIRKKLIYKKIVDLAKYNINPIDIFKGIISYMQDNNIAIPAYATLQTLIGNIITEEEQRLAAIIDRYLPKYAVKIIDKLLIAKDSLYPLSALKADPKGFNKQELTKETDKYEQYAKLFVVCENIVSKFGISKNNLKYYASLAIYYDVFKLAKLPRYKNQLYIICFAFYQSFKINNNLIDGFIHYVRKYDKGSEEYAKEEIYDSKIMVSQYQPQVVKILMLFNSVKLNNFKFKEIKKKAFSFIPVTIFRKIIKIIKADKIDKKEFLWEFHRKNHYSVTTNLRPLFMAIGFEITSENLQQAAQFIENAFILDKPLSTFKFTLFPKDFIPNNIRKYFYINKKSKNKTSYKTIEPYKYEYLIYQQIERGIHTGQVYSNSSIEYKSFDVDLALNKDFNKQKKIMQAAYMPALTDDIRGRLNEHQETLESLIVSINERINNGENKYIKIKRKGTKVAWTLPYNKIKPDFNNPFYDKLPQVNIINLLDFVDTICNFTKAFSHIKTHKSKKVVDYEYIMACILANATGLGIYKMAESSGLDYDKLLRTHSSRIRLETLVKANNIIIEALEKLPIFKYYDIGENVKHGASDGRKEDVRLQTFKSRYLRKYFKEKGVSSYTLLVNNMAINSKIITGHESHFLFDILFNNTSNVRPNIVSTDNEGENNLNFALLELIEILFAPHYKTITKKAKLIGTFKDLKDYQDYIIKPYKKFDIELIIEEWENIQKIYVALLSGDQTQSTIISKLSSHQRKNKTKDALWEYNSILRSIYLLLYIDDVEFRRNVRTALNRIEGYNQLIRAIENAGRGEFRGKSEMEILIWNECSRLVANAIIYYNAYLLSQILIGKDDTITDEEKNLLQRISPIAWQHLIFSGKYDFNLKKALNINEIVAVIKKCFNEELSKSK